MEDYDLLINHPLQELDLKGVKLKISNGVFSPNPILSNSTYIILDNFPDVKDKEVLDIGTGSGIFAIYAAKNGAKKVVATDVLDIALRDAEMNSNLNETDIEIVKSNLFENINQRFDYIFANLPIYEDIWGQDENPISLLGRFLDEARDYVEEEGKIYLTWFSKAEVDPVRSMLKEKGFSFEEISEEKLNYTWYLFVVK